MEIATAIAHLPIMYQPQNIIPDGLEALWLKTAGMPSDLVVNIAEAGLHLHRFPLYSKSSKFPEIAEIDKHTGQTFVR